MRICKHTLLGKIKLLINTYILIFFFLIQFNLDNSSCLSKIICYIYYFYKIIYIYET